MVRIVILPTLECNLRCSYCIVQKTGAQMTAETASRIIDKVSGLNIKSLELQFSGGEPTKNFSIIKQIVGGLKDQNIKYSITTNGTLLNEDSLDFIKDNNIRLSLSMDGTAQDHDANRGNSYKKIKSSISLINSRRIKFSSEMVITPESASRACENILEIEKLGASEVFIMPVCGKMWDESAIYKLKKSLERYSEKISAGESSIKILNALNKGECYKFNTEATISPEGLVYSGNGFIINPNIKEKLAMGDIRRDSIMQMIDEKISEERLAEIILPKEVVKSFKEAGKAVDDACEKIERATKIREYEEIVKKITIDSRLNCGDMPYPPISTWKNLSQSPLTEIWAKQASIIKNSEGKHKIGLYIHIPFCERKCFFCMCKSIVIPSKDEAELYLGLLEKEASMIKGSLKGVIFDSLYIGGGTPSLLDIVQLKKLMRIIHENFTFKEDIQKAMEVNPSSMNPEKWILLGKSGINRVTIGVQTADESLAFKMNRPQTSNSIREAVEQARSVGIKIVNIDLIAGLPGQKQEQLMETVEFIIKLNPDLIHINPFRPSKETGFFKAGLVYSEEDIKKRELMESLAKDLVMKAGYNNTLYEGLKIKEKNLRKLQDYNSREERYSILGLGFGAISHANGAIHYIKEDSQDYKNKISNGKMPSISGYVMNNEEEARGYIIKALEEDGFVNITRFEQLFKMEFLKEFKKEVKFMLASKKASINGTNLVLNSKDPVARRVDSKYFFSKRIFEMLKEKVDKINYGDTSIELKKF